MIGFPIDYGDELTTEEALHNVKTAGKNVGQTLVQNPWLFSLIPFFWSHLPFVSNALPDAHVTPGKSLPNNQVAPPTPAPIINVKPMVGIVAGATCITLFGAALPYGLAVTVGAICGGIIVALSKP